MAIRRTIASPLSRGMRFAADSKRMKRAKYLPSATFCTTRARSCRPEKSGISLRSLEATKSSYRTPDRSGSTAESLSIAKSDSFNPSGSITGAGGKFRAWMMVTWAVGLGRRALRFSCTAAAAGSRVTLCGSFFAYLPYSAREARN